MLNKIIAAAALAALSAAASAAGNLVTDGSFETPAVGAGTWINLDDTQAAADGWTATNGLEIRDGAVGNAQQGANFAELDTYENSAISQTLSTVVGQTYQLSFWYSDRAGTSAATNGLGYSAGSLSGSIAGQDNATGDNVWHLFTGDFTATGTQTVLSFAAQGTSDSLGTSLDNVSVTAVPEPATMALMASGLALLGLTRRRNRS